MKNSLKLVMGVLVAATVGMALGIAYAPKKGSKIRKQLKRKLEDLSDSALELSEEAKEKTIEKVSKITDQTKSTINSIVAKVSS